MAKDAETRNGVTENDIQLELSRNANAIAAKLANLSDDGRTQYQERAASKQQSLELYVLRRIQKKASKKTNKKASTPGTTPSEQLFFMDLEGDANLLTTGPPPPTEPCVPTYTLNADGSVPLDPTIWKDRSVKSLTKAERTARRDWMRLKRLKRDPKKAAAQEGEKKKDTQDTKNELVAKILAERGLTKGETTHKQKEAARKEAKRLMREEKKAKKKEKKKAKKGEGK